MISKERIIGLLFERYEKMWFLLGIVILKDDIVYEIVLWFLNLHISTRPDNDATILSTPNPPKALLLATPPAIIDAIASRMLYHTVTYSRIKACLYCFSN